MVEAGIYHCLMLGAARWNAGHGRIGRTNVRRLAGIVVEAWTKLRCATPFAETQGRATRPTNAPKQTESLIDVNLPLTLD